MEKIYENKSHSRHCTLVNEGQQTLRYKRNNEMSPIIVPSELPVKNFCHSKRQDIQTEPGGFSELNKQMRIWGSQEIIHTQRHNLQTLQLGLGISLFYLIISTDNKC